MKAFLEKLNFLFNLGVDLTDNYLEKRRVRFTNQLACATLAVISIFTIQVLITGYYWQLSFRLFSMLFMIIPSFFLNTKGHFILARYLLYIGVLVLITIDCNLGGRTEGHHYFYVVISLGLGIIFSPRQPKHYIPLLALTIAAWMLCELTDFQLLKGLVSSHSANDFTRFLNLTLSCITSAAIVLKFTQSSLEAEEKAYQASKLASLGEMAASIGHEINNPLAVIKATNDLMRHTLIKKDLLNQGNISENLSRIDKGISRISSIIDQLRKFSRQAPQDLRKLHLLEPLLLDSIELCRHYSDQKGILIAYRSGPKSQIRCVESQIIQVFVNLIQNACDATENCDPGEIIIHWEEDKEQIKIYIDDNGLGIDPSIREKIMEPFFTTKEVGHGTGLGLSVSKSIVENHGGTLHLDTTVPYTRFVVTLPQQRSNPTT